MAPAYLGGFKVLVNAWFSSASMDLLETFVNDVFPRFFSASSYIYRANLSGPIVWTQSCSLFLAVFIDQKHKT